MRLTVRRRLLAVVVVALIIGLSWGTWALEALLDLFRRGSGGNYVSCSLGLRAGRYLGVCGSQSVGRTVALLVVSLLVVAALCWLLLRWALRPVRTATEALARIGPLNPAERIGAMGRDEVGRFAAATDRLLERVIEAYEGQRRFAANASHELRTPLALQRALIEVGMASALTPDQADLLARQLLDANRRNEQLVEGLLVLAETDRGLATRAPVRLDLLVGDVAARHEQQAQGRQVQIGCALAEATVQGEDVMLDRLVANLLGNALKYNCPGGYVQLQVTGGAEPALTVANSGPAVPAETLPALFEAFRRGGGERLDTQDGSGLGLTIVRSIAAAHGAHVAAQSGPDGGLRIEVSFDSGAPGPRRKSP